MMVFKSGVVLYSGLESFVVDISYTKGREKEQHYVQIKSEKKSDRIDQQAI